MKDDDHIANITADEKSAGFELTSEGVISKIGPSDRLIRTKAPDGAITYKRQTFGRWAWDKAGTTPPAWHPHSGIFYLTPAQAAFNAPTEQGDVKIIVSDPVE